MRVLICCFSLVSCALAQSPDAFTGTWKLNPKKSKFYVQSERFNDGVRTYTPTADGQQVRWSMTDGAGKQQSGEYAVRCADGGCTSDAVHWTRVSDRTVQGDVQKGGTPEQNYVRSVSPDGKTLTITFRDPRSGKVTSVQVWDRQ